MMKSSVSRHREPCGQLSQDCCWPQLAEQHGNRGLRRCRRHHPHCCGKTSKVILLSSLDCVWCSAPVYLNQRRHMYNTARLKGCNMLQVNPGMAAKHAAAAARKTAEAAERSNWTSSKRLPQGAPDMPKPQCTASAGKSTYPPFLDTALSWSLLSSLQRHIISCAVHAISSRFLCKEYGR